MNIKLELEPMLLIMAILLVTILQLGGLVVRADLARQPAGAGLEAQQQWLSERFCREIGFPHNDIEACQMLMRFFR